MIALVLELYFTNFYSPVFIFYTVKFIQKIYGVLTECTYVFCVDLKANSNQLPLQH